MCCFYCENLLPPHPSPALNVFFFFTLTYKILFVRFLSDPVSIPCFFRSHYPLQSSEVKFFGGGGGREKCFTVFAFLEKQDRKPCFLNCGLLYRLLGHNQHTSCGARISVTAKTPGSCRRGDSTFAWIRPRKQPQTSRCMCIYPPHQLQQRALSGGGEKGWHQRRTEEDAPQPERTVLCLLDTHMPAKTSAIQT